MKHLLRFAIALTVIAATITVNAQDMAKITFEKTSHDFGTFKEDAGPQTTEFVFKNEGNSPLVLNNVRASCGCTTPKWTREPVAPGEKGVITVSYNPRNRPGSFNKTITVQSNASNSTVVLNIKGSVQQHKKTIAELYPRTVGKLRVKRNHISFVKIKQSEVKTEKLELVNDTDKPITVSVKKTSDYITAKVTPEVIPAKGKGILEATFDASKTNTYGFLSSRIYLSVDGSNDYKSSVGVSATVEEDFSKLTPEELANAPVVSFDSRTFDFGEIQQGDKAEHTFIIKNEGKSDLIIRRVKSSCGCTAVTPSKTVIAQGETAPIKVVFDSRGKKGRQSKSITVITNDPKSPTSTLRISSNIKVGS
ncbi:MAG: DUF1573 domain-containing protein [Chlorobi bacterium]|nr:DUF1573 domain-containing protein [Chlorobiota bacterium]